MTTRSIVLSARGSRRDSYGSGQSWIGRSIGMAASVACDNAWMKPFLILSHGLESGPDATKVSALAQIAEPLGFRSVRPDYRDLDASRDVNRIDARIARLI